MLDHRVSLGLLVYLEPLEQQVFLVSRASQDSRANRDQQGQLASPGQQDSQARPDRTEVLGLLVTLEQPVRKDRLDLRVLPE